MPPIASDTDSKLEKIEWFTFVLKLFNPNSESLLRRWLQSYDSIHGIGHSCNFYFHFILWLKMINNSKKVNYMWNFDTRYQNLLNFRPISKSYILICTQFCDLVFQGLLMILFDRGRKQVLICWFYLAFHFIMWKVKKNSPFNEFIWCWTLFSIVHPVINVRNQLVGSPFEKDVTIECNVEASPKSINYWIKDVKDGKFLHLFYWNIVNSNYIIVLN